MQGAQAPCFFYPKWLAVHQCWVQIPGAHAL